MIREDERWWMQFGAGFFAGLILLSAAFARAGERVHFPSLDADLTGGTATQLDGYLYRPDGDGRRPAMLLLHGCGGLLDRRGNVQARETDWAGRLVGHGYVVLAIDSFTPRGQGSECAGSTRVAAGSERTRDAYGALLYLQSLPFIRPDRVGLMGWSHGGETVLYTIAAADKARPTHLPDGDFRVAIAFYPGWCDASWLGGDWGTVAPLLVLNGRKDNWTPADRCERFIGEAAARGQPATMQVYDGAYHDFDWPDMPLHEVVLARKANGFAPVTGTNPEARADALIRVPAFLDRYLQN